MRIQDAMRDLFLVHSFCSGLSFLTGVLRHAEDSLTGISCLVSVALPWHNMQRRNGLNISGDNLV